MSGPKRNAECSGCLTFRPLLMPVRIAIAGAGLQELPMCLDCRLNWRDDRRFGVVLASTWEHARGVSEGEVTT